MTDFAKKMHREAEDIASEMETESRRCRSVPIWNARVPAGDGSDRTNVKPFYSPYANFDPETCKVVFIGDNPGGNPKYSDTTTGDDYDAFLDRGLGGYSAFLDERWGKEKGKAPMQDAVQRVFRTLFPGKLWREQLLRAASFNVCPLRTQKASHVPCTVWTRSEQWCNKILDRVKPKLIICCGNGDDFKGNVAKSPWAAMKRNKGFDQGSIKKWKRNDVWLKYGEFNTGRLAGASVIGLRHLSYDEYVPTTIRLLEKHRHEMKLPKSTPARLGST